MPCGSRRLSLVHPTHTHTPQNERGARQESAARLLKERHTRMRGVLSASPPFSRITPTTHLERGSWTAAGRGEQLVWPLSITPPQSPSIHPPIHPQRPITYNHPWAALVFTRFRLFQKTDFSALGGLGFFVRALVLHAVPCALCVCVSRRMLVYYYLDPSLPSSSSFAQSTVWRSPQRRAEGALLLLPRC